MSKVVRIKREYEFNTAEVGWTRVHEFDNFTYRVLEAMGLQGEKVDIVGDSSIALVKITRKAEIPMPAGPKQAGRPKSTKTILNEFRSHKANAKERDFKKGTLLIRKGYLKK